MSLDSIIFVCKCLVQCDLLRVTEAFSCKRAWQQKSAERSVSIVNRMSLVLLTTESDVTEQRIGKAERLRLVH